MSTSDYSKGTDRTTDVQTHDQTPFSTLIKKHTKVLQGLTDCGFINASPIQVAAIPTIIDGNDTIVEAKNGTGKTLTFVIPTLIKLNVEQSHLQTIILAPTREIAVQIQQCFKKVGQHLPNLRCEYFIGGTPVDIDKEKATGCQIAVGSPGRIKHLLNEHVLKGSEVKRFILDEVDRLFTDKNFTKDVRAINAKLPDLKQMIVVSASIDKNNTSLFDEFMKEYTVVNGSEEDMNDASHDPSKFLLGIKQYVACVKAVSTNIILLPAKNVRLLNILQNLPYTQCIVFTNYMTRVEAVCNMLRDHKYKADYIRGDQDQSVRLKLVDRLTSFKSKILVATDLIARGIDSSNVDLVINMDCPNDWATYLHRIGRAGRFGNKGNAFTILDDDKELMSFKRIINNIENVKIKMLPIAIEKLINEYADNELEDLDLTIESDILTKHQNGNEIGEENENKDIQNDSILPVPFNTKTKIGKSIYGPGITPEESLEKLKQVVKETEKELIDNNLVDKKYLKNRSFILFDPIPYLDDSERYMKYTSKEIVDIINNYDSDYDKYDAVKKTLLEQPVIPENSENKVSNNNKECLKDNQSNNTHKNICDIVIDQQSQCQYEENLSTLDGNSNKSNSTAEDTEIVDTNQRPQFSDICDLFNVPNISNLKSTHLNNTHECSYSSTNEYVLGKNEKINSILKRYKTDNINYNDENKEKKIFIKEEEKNSSSGEEGWSSSEDDYEEKESEDNYEEEESEIDYEEEESENNYEEEKSEDNYEEEESDSFIISDTDSENENDEYIRNDELNNSKNVKKNNVSTQKIVNNEQEQLVNYDILNEWYRQWEQQINFIQTCVKMSK